MKSNGVDKEGVNMDFPKIHESEYRFCLIMWEHEPVTAAQLVKLCQDQLGWKRTTTYTVIKRLGERGVLKNDNGTVSSLVSKDEAQACEINELVEKNSRDLCLPLSLRLQSIRLCAKMSLMRYSA